MALNDEIDSMRKEIRTDGYSMSIGEWISLYERDEIDIHPEFQRLFRWDNTQKSNLIESILLGIPIPPIFVSQRKDGVWDVIDGLQRLSTIYQFVGVLKDDSGKLIDPMQLERTRYLPSMESKKWNDPEDQDGSFTPEQRLLIKRSKIDASIVLRESDEIAKYELFQRLNTGGSHLTPQEVRNCIAVMINSDFQRWLANISNNQSFLDAIGISDKNLDEQYHLELALRFIVFSTLNIEEYERSKDVGEYLTDMMVSIAQSKDFDYDGTEKRFVETFTLLASGLGSDSFRRYTDGNFKGGFLLSPYEVIAFGVGYHYPNFPTIDRVKENIKLLHSNDVYKKWSGSGVRANTRLPQLIPLGRELFQP